MTVRASSSRRLEPLRFVDAGVLTIAYYEEGTLDGPAVVLLHGFPYDIHSYVDVAPQLAETGCRVIVPYLRGYGPTRFRDAATPRSGEQAALGADLIALMDALAIPRAVFAGYDWGARAACVGAALWPERCSGLVSVNGYLIQDIANALQPASVKQELAYWYQWYFQTERGRAGLAANRREIAKVLWQQWSPNWQFDAECFERSAMAFDNPDYVDIATGLPPLIRAMTTSSVGSRRCRRSGCLQSRLTATPMGSCLQPTARRRRPGSQVPAVIASSPAPGTICRRRSRRPLRMR
jgi:pimeloyl-ACP methyl ester carboxylesterase